MVLIPKGGGYYRGIGLVEVIWKAVAVILNRRFTAAITYHDFFHGFRAGRRYRDRHPRDQADSAGCGIEGGGPPCNLPGPAQVLLCLQQVQVPGYPGGLWREAHGPLPPTTVLGEAKDGVEGGKVIWCTLPQRERGDPGRPTVAQHFQCGGRHGGLPLGIPSGGRMGGR